MSATRTRTAEEVGKLAKEGLDGRAARSRKAARPTARKAAAKPAATARTGAQGPGLHQHG